MKKILRVLLFSSLLSAVAVNADSSKPIFKVSQGGCCAGCCVNACEGSPFLLPRSQGEDLVRESVGVDQFINRLDMKTPYGILAVTPGYTRSMKPDNIAQYYFGDQLVNSNTLLIQGSAIPSRNTSAWVADYFGLPTDYSSAVKFSPVIDNFMVDLNFYIGLEDFWKGTYFKIHSPLTHTRWNMNMTECIKNHGSTIPSYAAGKMAPYELLIADLPTSFMGATQGNTTFGDMQNPMCYGKFPLCTMDRTRLADINATLGWNIFQTEDHNLGLYVDAVLPTGTRPSACYLFEPIVGNGKHFELGVGALASWIFYRSEQHEDRYLGIWFDAKFNHLFSSCQRRSFDFCGVPNSRYMLLEQFSKADPALGSVDTSSTYQYSGNPDTTNQTVLNGTLVNHTLLPAINYSTFNVDAKINLQADMVLKFDYVRENWNFDFGYNFWARTGEKFACTNCAPAVDEFKYALKGDAWLYAQDSFSTIKPVSNTYSSATIQAIGALDNPTTAYYGNGAMNQISGADPLNLSLPPVFVTRADLNMGQTPTAISHKLFFNIDYSWKGQDARWLPFLGIGGSVEMAQGSNYDCSCGCDCNNDNNAACNNSWNGQTTKFGAISQWGTWIKGGVYFE